MIYLIYTTWANTKDNHAGMKNLCEQLGKMYPNTFVPVESLYMKNDSSASRSLISKGLKKILNTFYLKRKRISRIKKEYSQLVNKIQFQPNDTVILMEYMLPSVNQYEIARLIKNKYPEIKIYGLSHLVPASIDELFNRESFYKWTSTIDCILTLGSSLSNYYEIKGMDKAKIITLFHYVDDYYKTDDIVDSNFKVLVQGSLMRNLNQLREVITLNPNINFIVCQGLHDLSNFFILNKNVTLMPYLQEEELRDLMRECPISLNIMKDTIGSNVITTSMAMGQALICSDVGSIHDYCDDANCIFCNSTEDFSKALNLLKANKYILREKRIASLKKSNDYRIPLFANILLKMVRDI